MTGPMVLMLHGDPGAGKDTLAEHLVAEHGFTRWAFADYLRQMALAVDPIITFKIDPQLLNSIAEGIAADFKPVRLSEVVGQLGWEAAKRRYPEARRTLKFLATEGVRDHVSQTFWVDHVVNGISLEEQLTPGGRYVITDMRFETEYDGIVAMAQEHGFQWDCWTVIRPDNPHAVPTTHRSEQWHPPQSTAVLNRGIPELHAQLDAWFTPTETPACGDTEPHAAHDGFASDDSKPDRKPWCRGAS